MRNVDGDGVRDVRADGWSEPGTGRFRPPLLSRISWTLVETLNPDGRIPGGLRRIRQARKMWIKRSVTRR